MQPRDYSIMLGDTFYCSEHPGGPSHEDIFSKIRKQGNKIQSSNQIGKINGAMASRIGKDLVIGTESSDESYTINDIGRDLQLQLPNYRVNMAHTNGHTDGTFCPVVPGLILSISGVDYTKLFPNWEVVYLLGESWSKVSRFLALKNVNRGKWWVPGQELNEDFTNYVESWMNHWVGYVEESVFDVNMIVIDKQNVIVNGYNEKVFDAFNRHGITPHICNFRHRYFWDGGLHCITSDIHREGVMEDYFPERNQ